MERTIITGIVLTFNNDKTLFSALNSLSQIADKLIVLDSGSQDSTLRIASGFNAQIHHSPFEGYALQREKAYALADTEWIFALDADESLSPGLVGEIQNIKVSQEVQGMSIPVLTFFNNRPLCYGGMYPDYHLRIFRRQAADVQHNLVHEGIVVKGKTIKLSYPVFHYPYRDLAHLFEKMIKYAFLASQQLYQDKKQLRAARANIFLRPCWSFFSKYVLRLGFLDGFSGLVYHLCHAWYVFMKYFMLREHYEKEKSGKI
jgi:glycosyltransferase involved in cell wall biosynthesis